MSQNSSTLTVLLLGSQHPTAILAGRTVSFLYGINILSQGHKIPLALCEGVQLEPSAFAIEVCGRGAFTPRGSVSVSSKPIALAEVSLLSGM